MHWSESGQPTPSGARSVADRMDAVSLKGDKNNDKYYAAYVSAMNKANANKNKAYADEINRAHSLNDEGAAQAARIRANRGNR